MNYGRRATIRPPLLQRRDLGEYLKGFKPRCIAHGEDLIEAHRYAAKVELAQELLRMIELEDSPDITVEED